MEWNPPCQGLRTQCQAEELAQVQAEAGVGLLAGPSEEARVSRVVREGDWWG